MVQFIMAKDVWQLHEAKARFSELFRGVRAEGPQRVEKRHGEAVVIVAAEDFDMAQERADQPESLVEFFARLPQAASLWTFRGGATERGRSSGSGGAVAVGLPAGHQRDLRAHEAAAQPRGGRLGRMPCRRTFSISA
jgi:prevent-host-death family protein